MTKGTPSSGKKKKGTHGKCRRCGRKSFNISKGYCAACGFGKTSKMKDENWKNKEISGERKE